MASRIEQLNKVLNSQFLISESVYEYVKEEIDDVIFEGKKQLKGIENPIGIYRLN